MTADLTRALTAAREAIREFSDPPLCRVCDEPLTLGSVGPEGMKWAHYVRGEEPFDSEAMRHTDASIRWNLKPRADIVAVAHALIAQAERVGVLEGLLREAAVELECADRRQMVSRIDAALAGGRDGS